MLTKQQNELVTRVENGAPMGEMLRQYFWIPCLLSSKLIADGTPVRVRLLGEDFVAFRSTDGRVGFFDERCPHRGVSLALARNEDNALRCIFHGWKFSVTGETLEVPTQPFNQQQFCKRVPLRHYPVREAAGILWVWLGKGERPPKFQNFEFTGCNAPTHVFPTMHIGNFNWLQAVETTMDSAHLGILHQTSIGGIGDIALTMNNLAPVYDLETLDYGFRYASIRKLNDGTSYVRLNTFVAPWFAIISPRDLGDRGGTIQFTVPVDNEHSIFFFLPYHPDGLPANEPVVSGCKDPGNWPPAVPGGPHNNWGQDRELMKKGHFTGFPQHLLTEDLVVVTSQKPIVDRSRDFYNAGDGAIVRVQKTLLQAVEEFVAGEVPKCAQHERFDYMAIRPQAELMPENDDWRAFMSSKLQAMAS